MTKKIPEQIQLLKRGTVEIFKELYLDWLRFFRGNMRCGWECPGTCGLPDECAEIERVWNLWLENLSEVQRGLLD